MPNLFIDIEARFAKFQDSLDTLNKKADRAFGGIEKSASRLNGALGALGVGLSIGGLALLAKNAVDSVAALDDLSEKTSLTVETLASLRQVAIVGGGAIEDIAGTASKFAKSVSEANGGNKELVARFQQLGITVKDLREQNFDTLFVRFATEIANATDKTNALALASKLAGKSASEQLPFFNDLAERGLKAATVTSQMAAEADKVQKNFRELAVRSQETRDALVGRMLPALIAITNEFKKAVEEGDNFIKVLLRTTSTAFGGDEKLQLDRQFIDNVNKKLRLERQIGEIEAGNDQSLSARSPGRLKALKDQLDVVNLRIAALRKQREEQENANAAEGKPTGRTVGAVRDLAAGEKAAREAAAALSALDDLREAQSKIAVDAEAAAAKNRLAVLDHFYKEGFAQEENYWQVRAQIQKAAYDIERKALSENIGVREAAVARALKDHGDKSKEYHDATKELVQAQAQRNKLDAEFNQQGVTDVLARAKATEDYERAIKNINIQLEELNGNTAEATRRRLELQNESLRTQAENRGDVEGQQAITNLERRTAAQAQFNELQERAEIVKARLAIEEERIQNDLRVRAISEIEALRRTEIARRNALNTLGLTKQQLDAIAQGEDGFEKLRLSAEQFGLQLETLASQSNLVNDKARELFEGAVVDGWQTFRQELERSGKVLQSLGKGFERFAIKIIDEIQRIQAANLAKALMGDGSAVGFLAKLLGFGGGGTFDTSGISVDAVDTGPGYYDSYAVGTSRVPRTGLALVHEGEQIIPANEVGSGVTYAPTFMVDSRTDRAEIIALMRREDARTVEKIADMTRRGGGYRKAIRG